MELRTYIRHFDYALLAAVAGLVAYGMLIIYSATHADPKISGPYYYVKIQAVAAVIGALLMTVVAF
ncbi:MAG: stage V sporulation protein E, partial [Actinomycetota bacterium]